MSVSGLATFIAAYRHVKSFNSWVDACDYSMGSPKLTGAPFDNACCYMDWPLTAPLLSIEILSVMNLSDAKFSSKARTLGLGPALMIVSAYDGELVVTVDLSPRWFCWLVSMASFLYLGYELPVGLATATSAERDDEIRGKIKS